MLALAARGAECQAAAAFKGERGVSPGFDGGTVMTVITRPGVAIAAWAVVWGCAGLSQADGPREAGLADRLGCAHVKGAYRFTDGDFLNEGADRILQTGMRVIKVYLHDPAGNYPTPRGWPQFESLTDMARHPSYRRLFARPFSTFILTAYSVGADDHYWREGVSEADAARERRQFAELTAHLLKTYAGTGKTFVLQNWEGDWALRGALGAAAKAEPGPREIEGMIRWLNARQAGVEEGRRAVRAPKVRVYHACEVNLVAEAMQGRRTVTNDVLPHTRCDLYSYSAYDTIGAASEDFEAGRELFRRALNHIASRAPDSPDFGDRNVYVGEFGWPEVRSAQDPAADGEKAMRVIRMTTETALEWGCPYVVYWQVYDNESRAGGRRPANGEVRGFYLIRPDGSRAPAWDYFAGLLGGRSPGGTATVPADRDADPVGPRQR